jgi:hypothetical protein
MYKYERLYPAQLSKNLRDLLKKRSEAVDFFAFRDRESASACRPPRLMYSGLHPHHRPVIKAAVVENWWPGKHA